MLNLNFSCFMEQKETSEESNLFIFIHARGKQVHLSKTIASTAEVNKNALNSSINLDRTMPNTASIGLLVQTICENGMEKKSVDSAVTLKFINKMLFNIW